VGRFLKRVLGLWPDSLLLLESRGVGGGPVLDVGLDLGDLSHFLIVGLHQRVLILHKKIVK